METIFLKSALLSILLATTTLAYAGNSNTTTESKAPITTAIARSLATAGISGMHSEFNRIFCEANTKYAINENELNDFAWRLIVAGKKQEGIEILKLNLRAFPESWKACENLAQAEATINPNSPVAELLFEKAAKLKAYNEIR